MWGGGRKTLANLACLKARNDPRDPCLVISQLHNTVKCFQKTSVTL